MLDFREALNEKKNIRIESVKFSVQPHDDWTIIFMAASSVDLDVIDLMEEEYKEKILKHLKKKTNFDWYYNHSYEGTGYAFQVNKYSFTEYINKLLK